MRSEQGGLAGPVDIGAVVSGGITGIVGLAGIAGTAWQAKRGREAALADLRASLDAATANLRLSIAAEREQIHEAEKRRVYASYISSVNKVLFGIMELEAIVRLGVMKERPDKSMEILTELTTMEDILAEIELIAPQDIGNLAGVLGALLLAKYGFTATRHSDEAPPVDPERLKEAMRADLDSREVSP
jgi:hypothetical protein